MSRSTDLLERARAIARAELTERSLAHCERVSDEARRLAARFGLDGDEAALAGLLHDLTRDLGDEQLLAEAARLGLAVDPVERAKPYLLHAHVAAGRLAELLPEVGPDVIGAVAAHTVGAPGMSDLARVVYIADMTEPARDYEGVDALRRACVTAPLAECFRQAYGRSVRYVRERGLPLHPASTKVMAEIEAETGRGVLDPPEAAA